MTWGWGQVGILSLLTLILATGAAVLPTVAGVSPWAWTLPPPHHVALGPGCQKNRERKRQGQIRVTERPDPALGLLLPAPKVWELSSLLLASSSSLAIPLFLPFPGRALLLVWCR